MILQQYGKTKNYKYLYVFLYFIVKTVRLCLFIRFLDAYVTNLGPFTLHRVFCSMSPHESIAFVSACNLDPSIYIIADEFYSRTIVIWFVDFCHKYFLNNGIWVKQVRSFSIDCTIGSIPTRGKSLCNPQDYRTVLFWFRCHVHVMLFNCKRINDTWGTNQRFKENYNYIFVVNLFGLYLNVSNRVCPTLRLKTQIPCAIRNRFDYNQSNNTTISQKKKYEKVVRLSTTMFLLILIWILLIIKPSGF